MAKNITVYTSNSCASCGMVKQYLSMKGASYSEVNIEEDPGRQEEMISMSGQSRVPVIIVEKDDGSRDVTVGYNLGKLSSSLI